MICIYIYTYHIYIYVTNAQILCNNYYIIHKIHNNRKPWVQTACIFSKVSIIAVNQCCPGRLGHQSTTCLQGCNDLCVWSRFDAGELWKEVPVSTPTSWLYILRKNPPAFACAKQLNWICKRAGTYPVWNQKATCFSNFEKRRQVWTGFQEGKTTRNCFCPEYGLVRRMTTDLDGHPSIIHRQVQEFISDISTFSPPPDSNKLLTLQKTNPYPQI